jgi:RNA recognition motif-containing protein
LHFTRLIHFVSSACAEAAVTELNSAALNDRQVHLRIDREGETDPDGASSIYVGNLPWQVLDGQLETAFSAYKPYYCRVMRNMSGRSRGFAILKFQTLEDSQEAIKNMHKFQIGGRAIEVKLLSITKLH